MSSPRHASVALWTALALAVTVGGLALFFPFSKCPGCVGEGILMIPPGHPNADQYTQECGSCRGTGRISFAAKRRTLRGMTECRLCGGSGKRAECAFYIGPQKPCEWCHGVGTLTAQRRRQLDQEQRDRLDRVILK